MSRPIPSLALDKDFGAIRAGSQPDGCDPYPLYRDLRSIAPVWQSPWGDWYLTSAKAVSEALLDPACVRATSTGDELSATEQLITRHFRHWAIFLDAPEHTRLRMEMSGAFSAGAIEGTQTFVRETCRSLLPEGTSGRTEVVRALTRPLPVQVIARVLGLAAGDVRLIGEAAVLMREMLDDRAPDDRERRLLDDTAEYFRRLVNDPAWLAGRAAAPFAGLLALDGEVAAANLMMLSFAGHETTVHLLGSVLFHLAQRPDLWRRLRAEPGLAPAAVAEALRMESPVQKVCRRTKQATTICGVDIPANQPLVLMLGAANRDPEAFAEPDAFDIDRSQQPAMAFGRGAHLCLGRSLALVEATILLEVLRSRWTSVALVDGGADWINNSSFRGLRRLELAWQAEDGAL